MEATARHDFASTSDDELSFFKGDILKVLSMDESNWWKAELEGHCGYVPNTYILMKPHAWFHGKIGRVQSEKALMGGTEYNFLIRESEAAPEDFSLSVRFNSGVQHFKVLRDGAGKYFLWVVKFNSLNQLVEYHRTSSVSREEQIFLRDTKGDNAGDEKVSKVTALFDFDAQDAEEMSFRKGEVITVIEKTDANWFKGRIGTERQGLFPSNYVSQI